MSMRLHEFFDHTTFLLQNTRQSHRCHQVLHLPLQSGESRSITCVALPFGDGELAHRGSSTDLPWLGLGDRTKGTIVDGMAGTRECCGRALRARRLGRAEAGPPWEPSSLRPAYENKVEIKTGAGPPKDGGSVLQSSSF